MSLCLESVGYILNVFFLAVWDSPGEEELGLVPQREEEVGDVVVRVTVHALTDTNTHTHTQQTKKDKVCVCVKWF